MIPHGNTFFLSRIRSAKVRQVPVKLGDCLMGGIQIVTLRVKRMDNVPESGPAPQAEVAPEAAQLKKIDSAADAVAATPPQKQPAVQERYFLAGPRSRTDEF